MKAYFIPEGRHGPGVWRRPVGYSVPRLARRQSPGICFTVRLHATREHKGSCVISVPVAIMSCSWRDPSLRDCRTHPCSRRRPMFLDAWPGVSGPRAFPSGGSKARKAMRCQRRSTPGCCRTTCRRTTLSQGARSPATLQLVRLTSASRANLHVRDRPSEKTPAAGGSAAYSWGMFIGVCGPGNRFFLRYGGHYREGNRHIPTGYAASGTAAGV